MKDSCYLLERFGPSSVVGKCIRRLAPLSWRLFLGVGMLISMLSLRLELTELSYFWGYRWIAVAVALAAEVLLLYRPEVGAGGPSLA